MSTDIYLTLSDFHSLAVSKNPDELVETTGEIQNRTSVVKEMDAHVQSKPQVMSNITIYLLINCIVICENVDNSFCFIAYRF